MTLSGLDTPFDHPFCLPTLFDQAVNVSNADDFALDLCFRPLLYHCCRPCPSLHQAVNISSIDKSTNRRSCSTSSFTSSQTPVVADIPRSHNPRFCYSYNSCHCLDIADSFKTMNQKLLRPKDWVSPTISNLQKEFAELPTMDVLIIGAALFNTLM